MDLQDVHEIAYKRAIDLGEYCQECSYARWENNGPSSPSGWECVAKQAGDCLFYTYDLQGEDDE